MSVDLPEPGAPVTPTRRGGNGLDDLAHDAVQVVVARRVDVLHPGLAQLAGVVVRNDATHDDERVGHAALRELPQHVEHEHAVGAR